MRLVPSTRLVSLLAVALLLTGCTILVEPLDVHVRPPTVTTPSAQQALIRQFYPTRGPGASYHIGEQVGFRVLTNEDGYITLTAIDPTGEVYVFARNVPVRGGRSVVIDGISPRQRFVITAPEGLHRVSAHFTPARTDERIVFLGIRSYTSWQARIRLELSSFPRGDIAETRFTVRR